MNLNLADIQHIYERLREGMVPDRGLDAFAVGIEAPMQELQRQLDLIQQGEGASKFLRGGYGCGKTFMSQLLMLQAIQQDYAVSRVVVSPSDTPFYKFDEVYAKLVQSMQTRMSRGGALEDCLDRWVAKVEDRLLDEGLAEDAPDFDERVQERFEQELSELLTAEAGADFIAVLRAWFRAKQQGDFGSAMQLLSWLSGSRNIAAAIKRKAGIKGEIDTRSAMTYLKGILLIIQKAGHPGLLMVVDEMETILRMRADIREKSLNALRQVLDAVPSYKGLLWLFTGTPEFYDSRKGVAGLPPLFDRIHFRQSGGFVNIKQPQLALNPFDSQRLSAVAKSLRALYPATDPLRLMSKVSDTFIASLVQKVTAGFGGDVGIIPRQFLREFVDVMDLVEQYADYDPTTVYQFTPRNLSIEEEWALHPIQSIAEIVPVEF